MKKPMLLSPAGSYAALCAAVSGGADEVYFGVGEFNARAFARGFSEEELENAFRICRLHGVKTNITLNTLVTDREMKGAADLAKRLCDMGADAFIVQDLGLAALLRKELSGVAELHASTQCACHNSDGAELLSELGFSRIVLARELSYTDIKRISALGEGRFETETFVHGALCVSHSGQCLMSSVIGKRSGNRGMCAQPCRMEGLVSGGAKGYPLSLCDLTLAGHIEELINSGTASLKIEGRMKSPEYVYRVTSIWRRLLDNGKNADSDDIKALADIFSRGGFTDDYFTGEYCNDNRRMYGFRSDDDKRKTREESYTVPDIPNIPISMECTVSENCFASLTLKSEDVTATVKSESKVQSAKQRPLDDVGLKKNLAKLGGSGFSSDKIDVSINGNVFMPISEINSLRRNALASLEEKLMQRKCSASDNAKTAASELQESLPERRKAATAPKKRVYISSLEDISRAVNEELADSLVFPLSLFAEDKEEQISVGITSGLPFGVRLPRVFFDCEREGISKALQRAKNSGASFAEVSNIGHIAAVKKAGLSLYGGVGLNIYNTLCFEQYIRLGFTSLSLSPELNAAQMRDIPKYSGIDTAVFCKGRLTLMVLEACIIRANSKGGCNYGGREGERSDGICGVYRDRIGKEFPIRSERRFTQKLHGLPCRNLILNSEETNLETKKDAESIGADTYIIEITAKGKVTDFENRKH